MSIDKTTPPPPWELDADGEEDDAEGGAYYCARWEQETPQRDTPEEAIRDAHAIAAEEAWPAVLAFAERVAAWLPSPAAMQARSEYLKQHEDNPDTDRIAFADWAAPIITEAARTGGRLPGEADDV